MAKEAIIDFLLLSGGNSYQRNSVPLFRSLIFAAVAATSAATAAKEPQLDQFRKAIRRGFLNTPGMEDLLENNPVISKRFEKWVTITAQDQLASLNGAPPAEPSLRKELLERMERDQGARKHHGDWGEVVRIDRENQKWLAKTIEEHGWPGKSLVGADGARAAWIIAQHADENPSFQRRCLERMQSAEAGEVALCDLAYLIDRMRVNNGERQRYGTQFQGSGESMRLRPIEAPEDIGKLREEMRMMPLEVYLLFARSHLKEVEPTTSP